MTGQPVPISKLPAGATLTGSELVPVVQSGVTVKTTTSAIGFLARKQTSGSPLDLQIDFGCKANGIADDTQKIQEAILAGIASKLPVYAPTGEYLCTQTLTPNDGSSNVSIFGNGQDLSVFVHQIVGAPMFDCNGSLEVGGRVFTAPVAASDFTLPINTGGLLPNDFLAVIDTSQPIVNNQNGVVVAYIGEILRIRTVDNSGQVTLWGMTEFSYTTVAVAKLVRPASGFAFNDFQIWNPTPGSGGSAARGMHFDKLDRLRVNNVRFNGLDTDGARLTYTFDFRFTDCDYDDLQGQLAFTPYGVAIDNGSVNGILSRLIGRRGRHITTSGGGADIMPAHVTVADCIGTEQMGATYDQHQGCRAYIFANCQAHSGGVDAVQSGGTPGLGFQMRGRETVVINPQVWGASTGVSLIFGQNCGVIGGDLRGCDNGVLIENCPGGYAKNVQIHEPTSRGIQTHITGSFLTQMPRIVIEDNVVSGTPSVAAYALDHWEDGYTFQRNQAPAAATLYLAIPGAQQAIHGQVYGPMVARASKAEAFPRIYMQSTALNPLTSGQLFLMGISVDAGVLITSPAAIFAAAPTNQTHLFYALYDYGLNLLAQSADAGAAAPAAGALAALALGTPFRTLYSGLYYVGICQVADVVSTMRGQQTTSNGIILPPIIGGNSSTGLTTTAPPVAGAITASGILPYVALN